MPASNEAQESALVFRVYALEGEMKTVDDAIRKLQKDSTRVNEAVSQQAVTLARHEQQQIGTDREIIDTKTDIMRLATSVETLAEKVSDATSRLSVQLGEASTRSARFQAGFAVTVAASAIAIILTGGTPG
jgi:chromosome segregation ATPase